MKKILDTHVTKPVQSVQPRSPLAQASTPKIWPITPIQDTLSYLAFLSRVDMTEVFTPEWLAL